MSEKDITINDSPNLVGLGSRLKISENKRGTILVNGKNRRAYVAEVKKKYGDKVAARVKKSVELATAK